MILIAIAILLCIVLLVLGIVAPRMSRKAQRKIDDKSQKLEGRESRHGPPGRMAAKSTDKAKQATDEASEAGRKLHDA